MFYCEFSKISKNTSGGCFSREPSKNASRLKERIFSAIFWTPSRPSFLISGLKKCLNAKSSLKQIQDAHFHRLFMKWIAQ